MSRRKKFKDLSRVVGILQKGGHFFPSNDRSQEKVNRVASVMGGELLRKTFWDKDEFSAVKRVLEIHDLDVMLFYSPLNR